MKSLPIEILDQICTTLDLDTLPNFRLASKTFAAVGAQYLFEEFHLTHCHSESFTRFNSISDHETLRQHVKSLLFQGDSVTMEKFQDEELRRRRTLMLRPNQRKAYGQSKG